MFYILLDSKLIPYLKTSKAIENISKKQKNKTSAIEVWLGAASTWLSKHIRMNEFKRTELAENLKAANMDCTPEKYKSDAIVKAALIGLLAVPVAFILPAFVPVVLILTVILYNIEIKKVIKIIKKKRETIEFELPRLVFTISRTLKHSRDIVYMLESYKKHAGEEMKHELEITIADIKSVNETVAISRLEQRVASPMMSDVCKGLISLAKGNQTEAYWEVIEEKLQGELREKLKAKAMKSPKKVKRLSISLLACFMLTYVVVIISQIVDSLGMLFG